MWRQRPGYGGIWCSTSLINDILSTEAKTSGHNVERRKLAQQPSVKKPLPKYRWVIWQAFGYAGQFKNSLKLWIKSRLGH